MEIAADIARAILGGFDKRYELFRAICAQARHRFEHAEWDAVREASRVSIDTYDRQVRETVQEVLARFPSAHNDETLWPLVKQAYIPLLYDHKQPECAETFYNSVACRVLDRTYYRNDFIFWRPAISTEHIDGVEPTYRCYYPLTQGLRRTLEAILRGFQLANPFENIRRDLRYVVRAIREALPGPREIHPNFHIQVLSSLFFRNKAAYVVGRAVNGDAIYPFALPLLQNEKRELYVDTLLFKAAEIGTLFSLARAYFMVDMEVPSAYVAFLRTIMPTKTPAELYIALGLQKQGKTLFYRDLHEHLKHSSDSFVIAPGVKGMVMLVFTLPSFPFVFKVIRDKFDPPKESTPRDVRGKYLLVKYHDRVGRMADTLEYSDVAFPISRFSPALLEELSRLCPSSLSRDGDRLVIEHLYIERRMVPLDLWLAQQGADEERARHGLREYGQAIKDMAAANIFPGDLLLKNFGVTRWGRVVFYDYDEIQYLTDVNFRRLPPPRDYDDEVSGEPWFSVGPNDVFPEEFTTFLLPPGPLRELFLAEHGDLVDPSWWSARKDEIKAGVYLDVFPYRTDVRFLVRYGRAASGAR